MRVLSATEHVIKGLDAGAVDYLRKPFEFEELLARLRIVQRKTDGPAEASVLRLADLELGPLQRRATHAGQALRLTNREFVQLLQRLRNANRIVTKTRIAEKVWEVNFDMGSNVIEVHTSQRRRKLNRAFPELAPLLETPIGHGYRLHDPAAA